MSVLDRVGRIGDVPVRLAKFRPVEGRYQRRLSPVSPSEGFIAGDQFQLNAVPDTQVWHINQWSAGEGNDLYLEDERDVYNRSSGVRPKPVGEGLILGALGALTVDNGGSSTFNDGVTFGSGRINMWVGDTTHMYAWGAADEKWGAGVATGAGATTITSATDAGTAFMFTGHSDGTIWRWDSSPSQTQWFAAGTFLFPPVLVGFRNLLYALDGDDLYEVSTSVAAQRTIKADVAGSDAFYPSLNPYGFRRITTSDKGPVWVQRTDSGDTFLWEYNVGGGAASIIAQLPHKRVSPYGVAYANGVYVVAYRAAIAHGVAGDAYLYVQRGETRSIVPIRSVSGSTASKPILIAGTIGSDLIFYFDGAVWAYNLATGGIYMVGSKTSTAEPSDAAAFEDEVFLAGVTFSGNTQAVERVRLDRYMSTGTLESGRFDARYPGLPKLLTEVTVMTEPLPAGTSVQVAVSSDGGTFVALAGAHDVDGATSHTFVGSTPSTSIIGREFELKLTLNGTSTATPTVRSVAAVVTGAAHLEEWVMEVDCSDIDSVGGQAGWDVIDRLRGLAASQQVVTFTNPWEQRGTDGADEIPVRVLDVILPQGERRDAYATVRVRRTQMVVAD